MHLLDVNVVLALFREDHDHHEAARRWWGKAVAAGEAFTVPDVVWVGFCRLATNPSISPVPATFEEAWTFVEAARQQPTYLQHTPEPRVLEEFCRVCVEARASTTLVPDAYLAAAAVVLGAAVVTFDRDFRKFDGVRVVEPA